MADSEAPEVAVSRVVHHGTLLFTPSNTGFLLTRGKHRWHVFNGVAAGIYCHGAATGSAALLATDHEDQFTALISRPNALFRKGKRQDGTGAVFVQNITSASTFFRDARQSQQLGAGYLPWVVVAQPADDLSKQRAP